MIDFVGRRFVYLWISAVMLVVAVLAISTQGLRPGIDFTGGSTLTLVFARPVPQDDLRAELAALGFTEAGIEKLQDGRSGYIVSGGNLDQDKAKALDQALKDKFGPPAVFTLTSDQGGKTMMTVVFAHAAPKGDVDAVVKGSGISGATLADTALPAFQVRTKEIRQATGVDAGGNATPSDVERLTTALNSKFGDFAIFDFASISGIVASNVVSTAAKAVIVASIAILLYITYSFRKMPSPLRWGTCAIIALVHDALFVVGVFAILGLTLDITIDAMFISAILTVVGYSVHDSIVVFDRIRENIRLGISRDFATTVDYSLNQTLGRSLSTSLTTMFVLLALFLIGGATIRDFVLAMLVGIAAGTYSSIFVASQLLVVWERKEWRRLVPFLRAAPVAKA